MSIHSAGRIRVPGQAGRRSPVFLLNTMLFALGVRSAGVLPNCLRQCVEICLPSYLRHLAGPLVETAVKHAPAAPVISRHRFLLDGACMLFMQRINRQRSAEGGCSRYMVADSSMQHGREYEAIITTTMKNKDLAKASSLAKGLVEFRQRVGTDCSEDVIEEETKMMDALRDLMWDIHPLPIVTLASGRTSLPFKFHRVAHALLLEAGRDPSDMEVSMAEHVVLSGDMGTEFGLSSVAPISCTQLFPFLEKSEHAVNVHDEWDAPIPASEYKLSFSNSVAAPTLMHVIHNAANGVTDVMPKCKEGISPLTEIASMLHRKHNRQRLLNTCYSSMLGKQFHGVLKSWRGLVWDKRWGTVAHAVKNALERRRVLQWGWDKDCFNAGTSGKSKSNYVEVVDGAVNDVFFWTSLEVLDELYKNVRMALDWTSACPCHSFELGTDLSEVPNWVWKLWLGCPMAGRRLPEITAGDFLLRFKELCLVSAANLVLSFSEDLSSAQRGLLLQEFEKGRGYMLFILTMKTTQLMDEPTILLRWATTTRTKSDLL